MKKNGMRPGGLILALALAVGLEAVPASADGLPPADKVLEAYAKAIGGDALRAVKNMAAEFEFSMPSQGVYATGVEYWESPARRYVRIDLASMGVTSYEAGVVDGVAWESHPMNGLRKRTGEELKSSLRQASLNPFADWKAQFEKAETVAEEVVREKPCYKVVFTPAEGRALSAFFDKVTGLLLRLEVPEPSGSTIVVSLADYQMTNGITSARTIEQEGTSSYTTKYTSVAYDVKEIPEGTFELPAALKAPPVQ